MSEGNRHLDRNFAAYPRTLSEIFEGTAKTAGYVGHNYSELPFPCTTNRIILINIRYSPFISFGPYSHPRKLLDRIIDSPGIDLLLDLAWLVEESIQLIGRGYVSTVPRDEIPTQVSFWILSKTSFPSASFGNPSVKKLKSRQRKRKAQPSMPSPRGCLRSTVWIMG